MGHGGAGGRSGGGRWEGQDGEGHAPDSFAGGPADADGAEAHCNGGIGLTQGALRRRRSVKAARLATRRGKFDCLRMDDDNDLDAYASKVYGMAARYAGLGSVLDDAAMVKKLLDTVPDHLYAAVAGIEQFCDVDAMLFEEALGRLKPFHERTRRRTKAGSEREEDRLLLTAA
ncbi:retrotransposon protein [Hordeum vulgare]|nr:retrotransposon protein [Hordeum vulgare]